MPELTEDYTEHQLVAALNDKTLLSAHEVLLFLNSSIDKAHCDEVRQYAVAHNIDTSHWSRDEIKRWRLYNEDQLVAAVKNKELLSIKMVLEHLGHPLLDVKLYYRVRCIVKKYRLDTTHWRPYRGKPHYQLGRFFIRGKPKRSSTFIREKLVKIRGRVCESCRNTEWLGKPIALELHHVDGDRANALEDNLKLLCPNCHAQTPNYRIRNRSGRPKERL